MSHVLYQILHLQSWSLWNKLESSHHYFILLGMLWETTASYGQRYFKGDLQRNICLAWNWAWGQDDNSPERSLYKAPTQRQPSAFCIFILLSKCFWQVEKHSGWHLNLPHLSVTDSSSLPGHLPSGGTSHNRKGCHRSARCSLCDCLEDRWVFHHANTHTQDRYFHVLTKNVVETKIWERCDCLFHLFRKDKKWDTCRICIGRKKYAHICISNYLAFYHYPPKSESQECFFYDT